MSRDGDGRERLEDELRYSGEARLARPHINPKFSPKRGNTAPRVHVNPNFAHKGASSQVGNGVQNSRYMRWNKRVVNILRFHIFDPVNWGRGGRGDPVDQDGE